MIEKIIIKMKPPFLRITNEDTSKDGKNWIKSIFIFGMKISEWRYHLKENNNKNVGYK